MRVLDCPYRFDIRRDHRGEVARCGLLQRITQTMSGDYCDVGRDACELCTDAVSSGPARANPVLPSLVYGACERLLAAGPTGNASRWKQLLAWAEQVLNRTDARSGSLAACDVVMFCEGTASEISSAAQSILAQQDAQAVLHLVLGAEQDVDQVASLKWVPNVRIHVLPRCESVFAAVDDLISHFSTPYVAVQIAQTISHPFRLSYSVSLLEELGAEILAAPVETPGGILHSRLPNLKYDRYFQAGTLVIRRATLVDMGGFAERRQDADAEFVFRAAAEGRALALSPLPTITASVAAPKELGPPPTYRVDQNSLRSFARGHDWTTTAADVVLPFCGNLKYVDAALRSVLEQDRVQVVIHVIDDASPDDNHTFRNYWKSHPAVRLYRNQANVGPFLSFNNLIPYLETELAAVQDADDISLPQRLYVAGNLLRLADADVFGSRSRVFRGDRPGAENGDANFRWSLYPTESCTFFLENPTAVLRKQVFRQLGGYADFGEPRRNRTGVDTEFFARARYAGCRFAISRDVTVLYREHAESASRHPLTGLSSMAHREAAAERDRRIQLFRLGRFDPKSFGALHHPQTITERLV